MIVTIGKGKQSLVDDEMRVRNSLLRAMMEHNEMEKYLNTLGETKNQAGKDTVKSDVHQYDVVTLTLDLYGQRVIECKRLDCSSGWINPKRE